jgi:uncharacterized membrane protein
MRSQARVRPTATERGTISVFVVVVTVALIAVAGLVLDGGRLLAARREAQDIAANAARAGAQALDEEHLRAGRTVIDPTAGATAVARYLVQTPATGTSSISGDAVTVRVQMPVRVLLPLTGTSQRTVTSSQRARAVQGVTTGEG